ncbi:MAG: AMP-binding protein [Candidatus Acidiferrales bacterium]
MSSAGTQVDRSSQVESRTIAVVNQLLIELGSRSATDTLARQGGSAHLERDLGLGSLERVELLVRLDSAFSVRLPDSALAEADTVADLVHAVLVEEPVGADHAASAPASTGLPPAVASPDARRPAQPDGRSVWHFVEKAESLTEIVITRGRAEPDQAHIHVYEDDDQIRTITCGELLERASAVGAELTRRGLQHGDCVALMLPTGANFFFCFAGIWIAGGVPVPMYPPFRADRIEEYAARQERILRNAEVKFLITFDKVEGLARLLGSRVPSLIDLLDAAELVEAEGPPAPPETEIRPVDSTAHRARGSGIAFLQYTSGSTGDPKGVILTHANLLANIRSIGESVRLRPDDVVVSWLPLYHDMGLIGAWFAPLCFGLPLTVMSPVAFLTRPERWLRAIHRHHATISPAPNFAYELCTRKIADSDLAGVDLSSWRAALNGAEPVHAGTLERFSARFAPCGFRREALIPVYGLAEASLCVSAPAMGSGYKVDRILRNSLEREGRAIPADADSANALEFVSAGTPIPGMEVQIVDGDGQALGERFEGRLWFRSASATQGYYRNPEATRGLLRENGWLDSGDLAYRSAGELYITGRAKDIIIKGGRNLYPHEVEEVAGRISGVRTGCVVAFGAPDERTGTERFIIAAELRNSAERERISAEITRQVSEAIGVPPDRVELLPPHSIPKTSSGKLRRSETRRLFLEGQLGRHSPVWLQFARLALYSTPLRIVRAVNNACKSALEFVYGVYALAVFGVVLIPSWMIVALAPSRGAAARITRFTARAMLGGAGIRVSITDPELLDQLASSGPWIFAPNHSSYFDVLASVASLPAGVRFVAKGEASSMPLIGTFMRRVGHFAFDRSDSQARVRQSDEVALALRRGESVVMYPEGTFTSAPGIRPFQLGTFKSAVETGRPICPVTMRGARQILRDKTILPKPGRIDIVFGPLVYPKPDAVSESGEADWREIVRLRDAVREIIGRNSGEPLL